ncbi:glycoside hydrolase family 2 protein, partial [Klebsiella variicola subsp. variicola]|uniref:glycoside hydrolase family 2 protein n=1 Tax=Klebsiella variicola TaxID=244366 RepID=UPI003D0679DC
AYPDPGLTLTRQGDALTINARNLARAVMLDFGAAGGSASDNGFDLLPGESRTFTLPCPTPPPLPLSLFSSPSSFLLLPLSFSFPSPP